jgi:hypothetical protein
VGAIDINRLQDEVSRIKLQRVALESRKEKEKRQMPFNLLKKSVDWLCSKLLAVLDKLSFEEKQKVLRGLVEEVSLNLATRDVVILANLPLVEKPISRFALPPC